MIFCSPGDYTEQPARDKKPWARCFNRLWWTIVSHAAVFEPAVSRFEKKTETFDPGGGQGGLQKIRLYII